MLTYEDCVGLSDLTEEEVDAIAEHDHIPQIVAAEVGAYLVHTEEGIPIIRRIIQEDIQHAEARRDNQHAIELKVVLNHFVANHSEYLRAG